MVFVKSIPYLLVQLWLSFVIWDHPIVWFWYLWIKTNTKNNFNIEHIIILGFLVLWVLRTVINVENPPIAVDPLFPTRLEGKT